MTQVIDTSVAVKWFLAKFYSDKALRLRDEFRMAAYELFAPDIFPVEFAHTLTRAERRGRISIGDSSLMFTEMIATVPVLHPTLPLLPRAIELSSYYRIGVYDCLYVALVERECCEFVTAEDKLARNLAAAFPFILPLSSLP